MGTPLPEPSFVISDADYVDWLTEAMGGFAVPSVLKTYRKTKKYLFLGTAFDRDTDRMVANELTHDLEGGYFINDQPLSKKRKNLSKNTILNCWRCPWKRSQKHLYSSRDDENTYELL